MKLRCASCSFLLMAGLITTTCGQPERGAGKSPTRNRDEVVMEAAILHFLASTSDDVRIIGNTDGTGALLHVRNPAKVGWLEKVQFEVDTNGRLKDEDLIAELRKRNTEKFPDSKEISYGKLKLDRRIELVDLDTLLTNDRFQRNPKILKCRAYFRMYAPGFSKDGKQALVRSVIGTSPHGATATWLLELHKGRWNVKWMEIAAYV